MGARTLRVAAIARRVRGMGPEAARKMVQRLLRQVDSEDLQAVAERWVPEEVPPCIGDVTEAPRPEARKTPWVGRLRDGKTRGYWVLVLGVPWRGRCWPFFVLVYSSATLSAEGRSRNMEHPKAVARLKALVGDAPVVLDREFSYEGMLGFLQNHQIPFVLRLHPRASRPSGKAGRWTLGWDGAGRGSGGTSAPRARSRSMAGASGRRPGPSPWGRCLPSTPSGLGPSTRNG